MKTSSQFNYQEVQGFRLGYSLIGQPKMFAHLYYVDGLLIDTGQFKMQESILKLVNKLPVEQMFITHYHEDHTGNIQHLQNHFSCPVYASPACCEMMKAPPAISLAQKMVWGNRPPYTELLAQEGSLRTNNYEFQLIPIPGHAPDMIALYEAQKKWLFSADLYVHHYIGYMLPEESIWQQIQSIRRILQLDFDVLLCSHNPQLENGKAMLAKKLSFLENFYRQVANLHKRGHSSRAIFRFLKLKENLGIKLLSGGQLSKINMVKSVIRDCTIHPPLPA